MQLRQIALDTETTGLDPKSGHRIIEVAGVELINRRLTGRHLHLYINPQRPIDEEAVKVHGITQAFLHDKPVFSDIVETLMDFIKGAQLIIHNATFDVGFLNSELQRFGKRFSSIERSCSILDTLILARKQHPGQRNSLDALCKRYHINASQRQLHGALIDAQLLASVYLAMTGGQGDLFQSTGGNKAEAKTFTNQLSQYTFEFPIVFANEEERFLHQESLKVLTQKNPQISQFWGEDT